MFNDKKLKNVSDAVSKVMEASVKEELKGDQHKIDANKNNKVDAHDFKLLRAGKKVAKEEVEQIDEDPNYGGGSDIIHHYNPKGQKPNLPKTGTHVLETGKGKYKVLHAPANNKLNFDKPAKKGSEITDEHLQHHYDYGRGVVHVHTHKPEKGMMRGAERDRHFAEDVEQIDEGIEDKLEAARAKAKAAGKPVKGPAKAEKSNVTKVAGKAYGGSAQKDDDENDEDDEPKKASKKGVFKRRYNTKVYKEQFSHLLDSYINGGLKSVMEDLEVVEVDEEVDNETFTKEVQAQKEKAEGKGKKADIAAAAVQAVTKEEVEQIDELSISPEARTAAKEREKTYHRDTEFPASRHDDLSRHSLSKLKTMHKHHDMTAGHADVSNPEEKAEYHNATKAARRIKNEIDRRKTMKKEDVEQVDEISKSTYVGAMQTLSDPDTDRGHHDTDDKLISRAKKQHGEKFAKDLQGVYKMHWPRANQADGRDKLKSSAAVRTTQSGKANKQDVKTKSKEIQSRLGTHKKPNLPEQVEERTLTEPEMNKREDVVKGMKKNIAGFKERYGSRAKDVMYGAATKVAKGDK